MTFCFTTKAYAPTARSRRWRVSPVRHRGPELALGITAGNSSQMNDGAAAMLLADRSMADRSTAERLGLPIRAAVRHMVVGGDDAVLVLSAPNPVTRKLLARTGVSIRDFDAIECNEVFAAIVLMWAKEFRPDPDCYNPPGGNRPRSSVGGEWRAVDDHLASSPGSHQRTAGFSDDVRRGRAGQRHRDRTTFVKRLGPTPEVIVRGWSGETE